MLDLDEAVLEVVAQWVLKAESDLKTAALLLRVRRDSPTDIVCFHVQQCVEKYLKAMLVLNAIEFPRTHQISLLLALVPAQVRPVLTPQEQDRLTEYAVTTRYPGDYDPILPQPGAPTFARSRPLAAWFSLISVSSRIRDTSFALLDATAFAVSIKRKI
jgi:HEPN domain-containing protein